jgi:hypothetical protein
LLLKYLKYKRNDPNLAPLALLPFQQVSVAQSTRVIARALHAITPLIENQMVVRKALHEPVSVRNRTSFRTAHREIGKIARRDRRPKPAPTPSLV